MNVRVHAAWALMAFAVPVNGSSRPAEPATRYTAAGAAEILFEILEHCSDHEISDAAQWKKVLGETVAAIFQLARRNRLPQRSTVRLRRALETFKESVGLREYSSFIGAVRQVSSEAWRRLNSQLAAVPYPLIVRRAISTFMRVSPTAWAHRRAIPNSQIRLEESDLLDRSRLGASVRNRVPPISINTTRNIFILVPFSLILATDFAISGLGLGPLLLLIERISKNPILIAVTIFPNLFYATLFIYFLSPKVPPRNSRPEMLAFLSSILFHLHSEGKIDPKRAKGEIFSPLGVMEMLLGAGAEENFLNDKEERLLSSIREWGKKTAENIKSTFELQWLSEEERKLTVRDIAELLFALYGERGSRLPPGGRRELNILLSIISISASSPLNRNRTGGDLPLSRWAEFSAPAILTALHDIISFDKEDQQLVFKNSGTPENGVEE